MEEAKAEEEEAVARHPVIVHLYDASLGGFVICLKNIFIGNIQQWFDNLEKCKIQLKTCASKSVTFCPLNFPDLDFRISISYAVGKSPRVIILHCF